MSLTFCVRYRLTHADGTRQSGTIPIQAPKAAEARIKAREEIARRCGMQEARTAEIDTGTPQ